MGRRRNGRACAAAITAVVGAGVVSAQYILWM
jgi:hypothetical protein